MQDKKYNSFQPYEFQNAAADWLITKFKKSELSQNWFLISSPTSTGKTFIGLIALYRIWLTDRENIIPIFLTYSRIATEQTREKLLIIKDHLSKIDDSFSENALNFFKLLSSNICTVKSFKKIQTKGSYIVVVDEAHHLSENAVYKNVLKNEKKISFLIGLTGTIKENFEKAGFNKEFYKINRIDTGIRFPKINPVKVEVPEREAEKLNFKRIHSNSESCDEICTSLEDNEKLTTFINLLVERIHQYSSEFNKAIIFFPFDEGKSSREFVEKLHKKFNNSNIALPIYGEEVKSNSKLLDTLDAFRKDREVKFLVGDKMLDEALDISSIDAIILTKPTSSDIKYTQMIGRGLRPEIGKKETKLYDFRDNYNSYHSEISQKDYLYKGSKVNSTEHCGVRYPICIHYVPIINHDHVRSILLDQLEYFGILNSKKSPTELPLTPHQVTQFLSLLCHNVNREELILGEYFNRFNLTVEEMKPIISESTGNTLEVPLVEQIIKPLLQKQYGPHITLELEFPVNGGRIDLLWANDPCVIFEFGIEDVGQKYEQILNYKIKFEAIFNKKVSRCILIGSSFNGSTLKTTIDHENNVDFINWRDFFLSYCDIESVNVDIELINTEAESFKKVG